MDTLSRNQHSSIEASQIGWLFGDSLENGDRNGNLEEDPLDEINVENCDYTITSCVKDRKGPLTSSVSAESQSISIYYLCYQSETANKLLTIV